MLICDYYFYQDVDANDGEVDEDANDGDLVLDEVNELLILFNSTHLFNSPRPQPAFGRWAQQDRRSNTVTHASPRACGARLGGSV